MSLSSVEGRRAAAVLEETIRKLTFLEAISPDILQHRDELTKFVGDEVSQIIGDQRLLEERYEGLISQRSKLRGVANNFRYKLVQTEIEGVSRSLRNSTKSLCQNLKDNPDISGNLFKIQRERQDLIEIIEQTINEVGTLHACLAHLNFRTA